MPTHEMKPARVVIGGQLVPYPRAALVAVKADQFHVVPRKALRHVSAPKELPATVEIAGFSLSLWTAACIAAGADEENTTPGQYLRDTLEVLLANLEAPLRARSRSERRRIEAHWVERGSR